MSDFPQLCVGSFNPRKSNCFCAWLEACFNAAETFSVGTARALAAVLFTG